MTLESMFMRGIASPVLAKRWAQTTGLNPKSVTCRTLTVRALQVMVMSGLIVIIDVAYDRLSAEGRIAFAVMLASFILSVIGLEAYVTDYKCADLRFKRDCRRLKKYIPDAGFYSDVELISLADDKMCDLAVKRRRLEKAYGETNPMTEQARKDMKYAMKAMSRFRIGNKKWEIYFERADAILELIEASLLVL
jgi:hypothetical protein